MKYDILKVIRLKVPTLDHINWVSDESWSDFGGEKPVDDKGSPLYAYSTLQKFAREKLQTGELADWDGFLERLPETELSRFIFINREKTLGLRLAYSELMFAASQASLRTPEIIAILWAKLLEEVTTAGLDFPEEAIPTWNEATLEFYLPDSWRFPSA